MNSPLTKHLLFQLSPLGGSESSVTVEKESPLDHLPCYPASLPFAKSLTVSHVEQVCGSLEVKGVTLRSDETIVLTY